MAKAWKMAKENTDVNKEDTAIKEVPVTSESQLECDRDDSSQSSSSDSEND